MSGSGLVLMAAVAAVSLLALIVVVAVYLTAPGPARAGLASLGVSMASVGPAAGIGAASYALIQSFSALAASGSGGTAAVLASCAETALLVQAGCAAAALTLVVASVLGWVEGRDWPALPAASGARLVALALPSVLVFLVAGGALEYSRRTRNLIIEVVATPEPAAASTTGDPGAEEDASTSTATTMSIREVSQRLSLGLTVGVLGVPFLLLVLSGFGAATAILAWRAQIPRSFAALSGIWMLLQAALWAAAIFLFDTPVPA